MWNEQWKEENEMFRERHDLTIDRIRMIEPSRLPQSSSGHISDMWQSSFFL